MHQLPTSLHPPSGITLILWGAFALLSVVLLVLMRTRWGQARPISKCVMLSLAAHLLLVAFASVTRLFADLPPGPSQSFRLSIEAGAHDDDQLSAAPEQARPWEQPVITPSANPPDVIIPRIQRNEQPLPETPVERQADFPGDGSPPQLSQIFDEPPREAPAFQVDSALHGTHSEASAIDLPDRQAPPAEQSDPTPIPEVAAPERPDTVSELPRPAVAPNDTPSPAAESDASRRLQALAEAAIRTSPADAVAASQDDLRAAENEAALSRQATAPAAPLVGTSPAPAESGNPQPQGTEPVSAQPAPSVAEFDRTPTRRPGGGVLPEIYLARVSPDRDELARRYGGNAATQAAVDSALAWLAANQSADGRWDVSQLEGGQAVRVDNQDRGNAGAQADCGITALAILAFLGNGHTHLEGPYQPHVQHGLEFLLRSQSDSGSLAGDASFFATMYCHGMATLAISEAYAISGDERLRPYVQRAVNYTIASQRPTSGGWRYQPGDEGDMSQFGWQVMALSSAEQAGIQVPAATRAGMHRFLASASSGAQGGLASYRPGERASRTMTAEGLACRIFLGEDNRLATTEAASFLMHELPGDGRINLYYWYYATLSLHQLQGENWQLWNAALQERLLRGQRVEGPYSGSWDPDTVWGGFGGRVYSTSMAALCLEVYYRYLPLYGEVSP